MCYRIAGLDVHKKMLAVVVSDVEIESEYQFERRMFGSNPEQLRSLAAWLLEQEVEEVVMESTAQYWKPVWEALERYWKPLREEREGASRRSGTLHLAQAQHNRGQRGRKRDFPDAEGLVKRLVARELTLSFVPDAEQRLWRTVTRRKYQLRRDHLRLQNQLESLLEEAHIKLMPLSAKHAQFPKARAGVEEHAHGAKTGVECSPISRFARPQIPFGKDLVWRKP
jgi:transposase